MDCLQEEYVVGVNDSENGVDDVLQILESVNGQEHTAYNAQRQHCGLKVVQVVHSFFVIGQVLVGEYPQGMNESKEYRRARSSCR